MWLPSGLLIRVLSCFGPARPVPGRRDGFRERPNRLLPRGDSLTRNTEQGIGLNRTNSRQHSSTSRAAQELRRLGENPRVVKAILVLIFLKLWVVVGLGAKRSLPFAVQGGICQGRFPEALLCRGCARELMQNDASNASRFKSIAYIL